MNGTELSLPTLAVFQDEEPLSRAVLARLLCGVSTRKYDRTMDTTEPERSCTSKNEVSRRYIAGLTTLTETFFNRRIENTYPVIMIDGMAVGEMTVIAAMGITSEGNKQILGVIEGATENHTVVNALLADLIERGLPVDIPHLFVLDGGKGLHKAVCDTFGKNAVIQRCQVHKKRNVLSHLPKSEQTNVGLSISRAYLEFEYKPAKAQLQLLINNLSDRYPKAAESLREGLEETLTVHRLKIPGLLRQTLETTNPMECANSVCASIVSRVKNWQNGEQIIRTMAAGFIEAEKSFHRIRGFKQLPILLNALLKETQSDSNSDSAKFA